MDLQFMYTAHTIKSVLRKSAYYVVSKSTIAWNNIVIVVILIVLFSHIVDPACTPVKIEAEMLAMRLLLRSLQDIATLKV